MYIFFPYWSLTTHLLRLTDPASRLHLLCKQTIHLYSIKDLLGQEWGVGWGGVHTFILKIVKHLNLSISDWMYRCINLCLNDAQVQ